jgi:hypothetical protein
VATSRKFGRFLLRALKRLGVSYITFPLMALQLDNVLTKGGNISCFLATNWSATWIFGPLLYIAAHTLQPVFATWINKWSGGLLLAIRKRTLTRFYFTNKPTRDICGMPTRHRQFDLLRTLEELQNVGVIQAR